MGKIILFNMVSLDGYFEGKDREMHWHHGDKEMEEFFVQQLQATEIILIGRKTYQLMYKYWPTKEANERSSQVAKLMNTLPKIVFSKTLQNAEWNNTKVAQEPSADCLKYLKEKSGKHILIFGSSNLCRTLIKKDLVDEFRLVINPVVLGSGRNIFENTSMELRLLKVRVFGNGNVLCEYVKHGHKISPL